MMEDNQGVYQSIFSRMNRKQQKDFNKLPEQNRIEIIATEINNKSRSVYEKEIVNSFIRGYYTAFQQLHEGFVEKIVVSKDEEEINELTKNLLIEINKVYDKTIDEIKKIAERDAENKEAK